MLLEGGVGGAHSRFELCVSLDCAVVNSLNTILDLLHTLSETCFKRVVLALELTHHELPHLRIRDVKHLLQVILDRVTRDESVITKMRFELLLRNWEVRDGCAGGLY